MQAGTLAGKGCVSVFSQHTVAASAGRGIDYGALRPCYGVPGAAWRAALVLVPLLGGVFYWTFSQMWVRWENTAGYYSHGPLVVPIAGLAAWLTIRRHGLAMRSTAASRAVGLGLIGGALGLHLLCMFARITFVSGFAILVLLAGMVLYLGGGVMLRRLWFAIAFLAFMVPLPDITIYSINFHLKMAASEMSTSLVNLFGVPALRKGSDVFLENGKHLTVEDVCSGLRSLMSLLAFATLFTYACRLRGYKRLLLFLSAVPIAILANVVRITVLILVADLGDVRLATPGGWVHDSMGFLVFVVAFCIMFLEEELLDLLPGEVRGPAIYARFLRRRGGAAAGPGRGAA